MTRLFDFFLIICSRLESFFDWKEKQQNGNVCGRISKLSSSFHLKYLTTIRSAKQPPVSCLTSFDKAVKTYNCTKQNIIYN